MKKLSFALIGFLLASCGGYPDDIDIGQGIEETDRSLFERARFDLQRGDFTRARLLLQTLISTYPDSEFVPDAMYAMAESWYQIGTRADMIQADFEFSNYITFFPTTERADDAQMMRAMTHIRQMEGSDRDPSEALLAEVELLKLIDSYPDSDLLEEGKDKLRSVQNVLAEHSMKVGNHYYSVGAYAAAALRYVEVLETYPDFSKTAEVLYRLGELWLRTGNEGESLIYYNRIVREHPLSGFDEQAEARLVELGQPIPEVNPAALARAQAAPPPPYRSLGARMFGVFGGGADISTETTAASILKDGPEGDQPIEGEFSIDGVIVEDGQVVEPAEGPEAP